MKYFFGTKVEMTQFFDDKGLAHAATIVEILPATVMGMRTQETDGYEALKVGFGTQLPQRFTKAEKGIREGMAPFRHIREVASAGSSASQGDALSKLEELTVGETLQVAGISKAKGFQGVVKRHGFAGGRRTHGQKHSEREPGSIGGAGRAGGRVVKGTRMAGRMGGERITVKNLKVLALDAKKNLLLIKGAVPGRRGTLLEIVSRA